MEIRRSQFGPSLAWLLSREVPAARLAQIFKTTPENIRVIAFRARHDTPKQGSDAFSLNSAVTAELAEAVGARTGPDEVVRTPANTKRLDHLRNELDRAVRIHFEQYAFLQGAHALRGMLPKIGFAGDVRRITLRALLHQQIAWFLTHSGRCESAFQEAARARDLWRLAYHERSRREYAENFVKSALIGSNALLLTRNPERSWKLLDIAKDAADSILAPPGSEYFRQRGVALFQLKEDERSAEHFESAATAMELLGEAKTPAQVAMTGSRHTSLAKLDWEGSRKVLETARQTFGEYSLESAMALHWAVACGVSIDSALVNEDALQSIVSAAAPSEHFGHQLTIRELLTITPELGLDLRLRRAWVRRALYENAFRAR